MRAYYARNRCKGSRAYSPRSRSPWTDRHAGQLVLSALSWAPGTLRLYGMRGELN